MKRLLILPLALMLVGYATSSCSSSASKDKERNDSIATVPATMTSPDLALFQLKGKVKKCIIPVEGLPDEVYEFDEKGNLVSPKYEKVERDKNGAIVEYYDPESESTTRITWKDGKVTEITNLFDDGINSDATGYEYDGDGNIIQMAQQGIAFPTNYSNYKYDEFGNWISRDSEANGTTITEKRYITYYDSEVGQDRLLSYYAENKENAIKSNIEQEERQAQYEEEQRQEDSKGPEWIQGSWELTINSPYGAIATYHLTINGQNAHLVEGNKDKYNGRYEIKGGQMIVGPRKYDINDQYQRLEYAQYRWHKISGGSNHQAYQGRNSSFSSASDVMRYLSGRTFYNSGDGLRIDYNAVYLNGTALTGAPRVVDISGNSATVVANSPYSGGGTLRFYVNSANGTVTQSGDVYRER